MKREIKFRVFDKSENTMTDWDGILKHLKRTGEAICFYFGNDQEMEMMQFTGLKDKNGKDIYEGDVVRFNFWYEEGIGKITFENGSFGITNYNKNIEMETFKSFGEWDEPEVDCYPFIAVIGNIYENPDLPPAH